MAGPFRLDPGQTQFNTPTHPNRSSTRVIVTSPSDDRGRISMTASGSSTKFDDLQPGKADFDRDLGGVLLAVKNEGKVSLTIETP
jgi:hypothetical protein